MPELLALVVALTGCTNEEVSRPFFVRLDDGVRAPHALARASRVPLRCVRCELDDPLRTLSRSQSIFGTQIDGRRWRHTLNAALDRIHEALELPEGTHLNALACLIERYGADWLEAADRLEFRWKTRHPVTTSG